MEAAGKLRASLDLPQPHPCRFHCSEQSKGLPRFSLLEKETSPLAGMCGKVTLQKSLWDGPYHHSHFWKVQSTTP